MNRKSIGEKIQILAKVVLIVGLFSWAVGIVVSLISIQQAKELFEYADYSSLLLYVRSNAVNLILASVTGFGKVVIAYFCLRGFGHLIINSDSIVKRMYAEGSDSELPRADIRQSENEGAE